MNGKLVEWKDATIHIASHVVHYGSGVFEGARCYETPKGSACFRLDAHMRRLQHSAKIYRMEYPLDLAGWMNAVLETIRANKMKACYIRPLLYRGYGTLGVNPEGNPLDAAIMLWEWGAYLGHEALEQGVDVKVSSWTRMAPNTLPAMAKSHGQLRQLRAGQDGGDRRRLFRRHRARRGGPRQRRQRPERLHRARQHHLHAGARVVDSRRHHARLHHHARARARVHRDRIGHPARGVVHRRRGVLRRHCGRGDARSKSIDKIQIGKGRRGPITEAIQRAFFDVINGEVPDTHGWLTYVYPEEAALRKPPLKAAGVKSR